MADQETTIRPLQMEARSEPAPQAVLRVALVTGSYNYIRDGVALTLNRLVAYLETHGVETLIFTPVARTPALEHAGEVVPAPSLAIPFRPEYRIALGLTAPLRARMRAFRPDIVHLATPDILGHQALRLAKASGWPTVASYHTRYDTYLKYYGLGFLQPVAKAAERRFYGACDEVFVPSPSMAETLAAEGVDAKFHLWTRGVDTERFHPSRRSEAWRAARGVGANDILVTFVSRLVREKRLDDFVAVVRRLQAAGAPARALVVGDGPERAALERALPDGLFEGFVVGDELATAYASADIFVFPSDTETFGSVTLEAMASGLPTICADATGSRSLVDHGVTGFLAPVGDVDALGDGALRLANDPVLRQAMGEAARARSLKFSWDEAMAGALARYRALTGR
ncbi:MAG: glycosyltransferase family 1 protein [Caulobacteraceae bacterium]|nr:glycosyltransferase family 1 protein [Caulobacteraceae bacterium]